MRTLTAPATLVTERPYAAPVLLITMTTTSGAVFRLSDYPRVIGGVEYAGLIQNPEDLVEQINDFDGGGTPATARLVLFNTMPIGGKPRFSDLIQTPRNQTGTYDFQAARVDIDRVESGHALADAVRLQSFYLEAPTDIGSALITLQMSDLANKIEDAMAITKINRALFPACPADAIETEIRRPFGTLKNVTAVPIQDGAVGALNGDHTDTVTTLTLQDAADFPTSGTALIDEEFVTWNGKAGTTQLLNVSRGAQSSTAADHADGADVMHTRTDAYIFVVGEGVGTAQPITAMTNVRVNGRPARTSPTVTAADLTLVPNKSFGTIKFTPSDLVDFHTLPLGLEEVLTPATLSITGDGSTNQTANRTITPAAGTAEVAKKTRRTVAWTVSTTTAFTNTNTWAVARYLVSKGPGSSVPLASGTGEAGNTTGFESSGSHTIEYEDDGPEIFAFNSLLGSARVITCVFNEYTVTHESTDTGTGGTAGRVIGEVTCDVQGIQDDSSGTFSGTASALLENPTDIVNCILQSLYGVEAGDIDGTWAITRALHASAAYKWAMLLGFKQFSEFRRLASEQARARLVLSSGSVGFRFRSYRPTADLTFEYDPESGRTGVAQEVAIKLTSPTERLRGLTARYGYDDQAGEFRFSLTQGDPSAANATPPMDLTFVNDAATARDLCAYWFGLRRRPRFAIEATAWHNALALEQGDHIAIAGHPVLEAHGADALIFAVQRKTDRGGQGGLGQIALGGLEDTIEGDIGAEDEDMWGSRGLLAKNNAATPNTQLDVTAAAVMLRKSDNTTVVRHNPGSLTCNVSTAGPAANGRDQAGAFSASSWVHFYWVWDPTNGILATLASTVAPPTGPTLPTNFTHWCYIGAVYFNASSQLVRTTIAGSVANRTNVEAVAAAVTVNTEQSLDGSAIWPPKATRVGGGWTVNLNVLSDSAELRPESGIDSGLRLEATGASSTGIGGPFQVNVTGQTLWYIQSANASRVWRLEISEYWLPNGAI
jgi:hypothetical protein